MTKIDFFSNAPSRLDFVALLLNKIHAAQKTAVVYGETNTLNRLSDVLWHNPIFLAHDFHHTELTNSAGIILVNKEYNDLLHYNLLINLSDEMPIFFAHFARLIEVVPKEDKSKQAARERWGFYKSRGYAVTHHDIATKKI